MHAVGNPEVLSTSVRGVSFVSWQQGSRSAFVLHTIFCTYNLPKSSRRSNPKRNFRLISVPLLTSQETLLSAPIILVLWLIISLHQRNR